MKDCRTYSVINCISLETGIRGSFYTTDIGTLYNHVPSELDYTYTKIKQFNLLGLNLKIPYKVKIDTCFYFLAQDIRDYLIEKVLAPLTVLQRVYPIAAKKFEFSISTTLESLLIVLESDISIRKQKSAIDKTNEVLLEIRETARSLDNKDNTQLLEQYNQNLDLL